MRHEPTYEGRPLVRPDEEVVDQGLGFDLTTLMSRRRMLRAFGLGAAAAGLAACASGTSTSASSAGATTTASATGLVEIPDETAGPYPGDGSNGPNVLTESGIARSDIRSSFGGANGTAEGAPLTIQLTILDIANGGSAFAGAAVYVWHCNRAGEYSMYSSAVQDQNYLRGVQIADAAGRVSFTSIFPGCYAGRWPHIHFEVYPDQASIADASNAIATSQIAIPQDACEVVYAQPGYEQSVPNLSRVTLAGDNVFGDDGGVHELGAVTGGYTVSLTAAVDTTTTPTAGRPPSR